MLVVDLEHMLKVPFPSCIPVFGSQSHWIMTARPVEVRYFQVL